MKISEQVITKINNVLMMNYEAEKIYSDASDLVMDDDLKTFFREQSVERNGFIRALKKEITKLGEEPQDFDRLNRLSSRYHMIWKNVRPLLKEGAERELLDQVCNVKQWSIDNYNSLLQEINLSLSLCKLLVGQRDKLHVTMNTIKANRALTVSRLKV
ncbi:DUF2383 domain-containing protein [Aestuariivivens sediminicola]|uniref:DUF2383 domain-containing protein n=1 Tax=Aestuariivivens sediminicola TaxID=2913560 RepID=UPI001F596E94|nr:DUF2383 domain-containing protein [Aestuariivivens sediminicola]